MRYISALKDERVRLGKLYPSGSNGKQPISKEKLMESCKKALHFGFLLSYAQGLQLLNIASAQLNYKLNIAEIIRVWKGGCIIRSAMLGDLRKAYLQDSTLSNVIGSAVFRDQFAGLRGEVVNVIKIAIDHQLPVACMSTALQYFDAYVTGRLPANLIQAQRDYFGAHTYERLDKEGVFHTEWVGKPPVVTSTQKPGE